MENSLLTYRLKVMHLSDLAFYMICLWYSFSFPNMCIKVMYAKLTLLNDQVYLLTLSAHAHEDCCHPFVCVCGCVCLSVTTLVCR